MNKFIILSAYLMLLNSLPGLAQENDGNNQTNDNQNRNQNSYQNPNSGAAALISKCVAEKKESRTPECESMYVISALFEKPITESSSKQSWNRAVSCRRVAGFTLDYDDCNKTLNAYNAVIAAEQTLFASQSIKKTDNINQNQATTQQAVQNGGDLQAAAIEANKSHASLLARLNQDQANTYYVAFSTLGAAVSSWQGDGKKSYKRHCKEKEMKKVQENQSLKTLEIPFSGNIEDCKKHYETVTKSGGSAAFANESALSFFKGQLVEIGKKAMEAQIRAGNNIQTSQALNQLANQDQEEGAAPVLDRCMIVPIPKDCIVTNSGQQGNQFQGADLSFGTGANNVFGAENNGDSSEGSVSSASENNKDGEKIADVANPFQDEAKKASGILDPASAANVSPGSASSAPGGGGGGGGGGGAPPGGSDLKSASDVEKPGDTKSTSFKAAYSSGGGAKFNKVGDGKSGDNPFASLFDKSAGGGVEEDRSIASQDISDSSLGLFDKISKKYGQVNADKRIKSDLE